MKTKVRAIPVYDDSGGYNEIGMRMPNGDLKRHFLLSLLKDGSVVPSESTVALLREVSLELERVYRLVAKRTKELEDTEDELDTVWCENDDLNATVRTLTKALTDTENERDALRSENDDLRKSLCALSRILSSNQNAVVRECATPNRRQEYDHDSGYNGA